MRELAPRIYGSITHLVVSPVDPEAVYVYSGMGLWRFEAASEPEGKITRLSGANGLPEGGVKDRIHLGRGRPDPDRRGGRRRGSTAATTPARAGRCVHADPEIAKLHVNPWDPQRMIISYPKGQQLKVSTDGGASFGKPDTVNTGPGGGDDGMIGELSCLVVWHPKNPDRIWAHGGPMHWQSDDGGRNWRPANGYFNGKQHQNWFIDQMFDPVDPDRFGYFMTDFGVAMTRNRGLWFERGRMVTRALDLKHSTVNGGALHPDPARGIVLASVGKMNSGKLLISRDDGATWAIASDGDQRRQYVGFDLDDPSYAFQWRERSTDHGVTWSEMEVAAQGLRGLGNDADRQGHAAGPGDLRDRPGRRQAATSIRTTRGLGGRRRGGGSRRAERTAAGRNAGRGGGAPEPRPEPGGAAAGRRQRAHPALARPRGELAALRAEPLRLRHRRG